VVRRAPSFELRDRRFDPSVIGFVRSEKQYQQLTDYRINGNLGERAESSENSHGTPPVKHFIW